MKLSKPNNDILASHDTDKAGNIIILMTGCVLALFIVILGFHSALNYDFDAISLPLSKHQVVAISKDISKTVKVINQISK